jgi:hypothetical protein
LYRFTFSRNILSPILILSGMLSGAVTGYFFGRSVEKKIKEMQNEK